MGYKFALTLCIFFYFPFTITGQSVKKVHFTSWSTPEIIYLLLRKDGKFGFMNPEGSIITPVKFNRIQWDKHEQYCTLFLGDVIGFANYRGQQFIPAIFSAISKKTTSLFEVSHPDGYTGYIDYNGLVFLPDYVSITE